MENIRVVAACEAADVKVVTPVVELRPGVTIAIVRDSRWKPRRIPSDGLNTTTPPEREGRNLNLRAGAMSG